MIRNITIVEPAFKFTSAYAKATLNSYSSFFHSWKVVVSESDGFDFLILKLRGSCMTRLRLAEHDS